MRINLINLSVVAVSTLGLSATALDMARAYVMKNPDGAYGPLAMQLLVELQSRRMLEDGSVTLKRRLLLNDLVYRPVQALQAQKVYDSADDGATYRPGEGPIWRQKRGGPSEAQAAREAIQYLQIRAKRFGSSIESCRRPPPVEIYLACIAGAVDDYARWVEEMPPTRQSVAPVAAPALREAARRIRASRDVREARAAVADTAAAVRKSIELVQAGTEDTVRRLELSQRSVIINSMASLDDELVQAMGI